VTNRVLLAVDDSPAALAAARLAVDLARTCGAALRVVTVLTDHVMAERLGSDMAVLERRRRAAASVLRHVARLAEGAGIPVDTAVVEGEPAGRILDAARRWPADMIVVGRANSPGAGQPYIGSQTRGILEFADVPVLVVPPRT
jgi:nucleotide-binding universal stress UspA family protein